MKAEQQSETARHSDTRRMHLRGLILIAGEIVATYWPMGTFVHHNPLHGLEDLPFTEAVRIARERLGGNGYLSNSTYRDYLASGRIQTADLDAALASIAQDKTITLGDRQVSHAEVLRSHLVHGATAPAQDTIDSVVQRHEDRDHIQALAQYLTPMISLPNMDTQMKAAIDAERLALGRSATLSDWCDRMLGSTISERINGEMIKWCEAFLDEGHASWPMPGREKGFFNAWHWLAKQEWFPCGIAGSRRKLSRLPTRPDDALLDSLDALRLPVEAWPDYLSPYCSPARLGGFHQMAFKSKRLFMAADLSG